MNNDSRLVYSLPTSLSFDNYLEVEKEINGLLKDHSYKEIELDASRTNYISSAGLRVILSLFKSGHKVFVTETSTVVFDIFEMTGFTNFITVERAFRKVSIEGCKCIGKGAHGTVYSLAPDTIVKVYSESTSLEDIKNERELSKKAFVLGLPTAIALDVVKVNNQFGTIFELLDATSCVSYVNESQKNTDDFVDKAVSLLKKIHSVEITDNSLPDMKEKMFDYLEKIKSLVDEKEYQKLEEVVKSVPQTNTLLHGDFHLKNQLMCHNELMLIDMDTLCVGDPILEFVPMFNAYYGYGIADKSVITAFLGISNEKAEYILREITKRYYSDLNEQDFLETTKKARILGLIRAVHFCNKRHYEQSVIDQFLNELRGLLTD